MRAESLVIQPLPGIGDMVWHLPLIHAIASQAPGGQVSILTKPRSGADRLLAADDRVAEVLWLERNPGPHDGIGGLFRLAAMLRQNNFAQAWVLHDSARYALVTRLAGIPQRFGYGCGGQRRWLNAGPVLPPAQCRAHPIEKAALFRDLAGLPEVESEPVLPVSSDVVNDVRQRLGSMPRPWLALGIGSSEPYKQWGGEPFAMLATAFCGRTGGSVFVVGGPAENTLAMDIGGRAQEARLLQAVAWPLDETAALLSVCDLFVGNDTGVLNMAAAVGTPAIGLFGASEPLWHDSRLRCVVPARPEEGMAGIRVDEVLNLAMSLLER